MMDKGECEYRPQGFVNTTEGIGGKRAKMGQFNFINSLLSAG